MDPAAKLLKTRLSRSILFCVTAPDRNCAAMPDKCLGDPKSYTAITAGHNRDTAFQIEQVRH
jgi:hypothetical protein